MPVSRYAAPTPLSSPHPQVRVVVMIFMRILPAEGIEALRPIDALVPQAASPPPESASPAMAVCSSFEKDGPDSWRSAWWAEQATRAVPLAFRWSLS